MQMIFNSMIIRSILWIFRKYIGAKEITKKGKTTMEKGKERHELPKSPIYLHQNPTYDVIKSLDPLQSYTKRALTHH